MRVTGATAACLVLAVLGGLLRASGVHRGNDPIRFHPDEIHYAGVAQQLTPDDLDPHRFENPPLLTYALYGARALHASLAGEAASREWIEAGGLYEVARWIGVVLGTATALVVAATARRLFGPAEAVAAAAVVALSFLHGRDSHFGVNDVPMVFLVAAALWCSIRAWLGGSRAWLYAAAALAGLAAATKYNGAAAVVLPVAALALRREPAARAGTRAVAPHLLPLGAVFLAGFVAGNPYSLLAFEEFRAGFVNQYVWWGDRHHFGQSSASAPVLYAQASLALVGWAHLAAAIAGAALVLARDRRLAALLLAFPLFYLAGMWSKTLFFWRFALPLLPFVALLAACGWVELSRRLAGRGARAGATGTPWATLAVLLAVGSAEPAARLVRHDQLLHREATWSQARDWVLANVPPGSALFFEGYPPEYPAIEAAYRAYTPRQRIDRLEFAGRHAGPGGGPAIDGGGWLLTDSRYEASWRNERDAAYWDAFYAQIRALYPLVAEFPPGPHGDPQPFVSDTLYSPLVDLWSIDRPGHTIRIWRIPPGEWRPPPGIPVETSVSDSDDEHR